VNIPSLETAQALLAEAERLNPGPWVAHSVNVARAARLIAQRHSGLDADRAYILGLLHDIGRREGKTGMRHVIDGYLYLQKLGFDGAARICLTHSFPYQNPHAVFGAWDCTAEEFMLLSNTLLSIAYDDYDLLLQLCDSLAQAEGFCLIEKRLVDVFMRYAEHGVNSTVHTKWRCLFEIQRHFEQIIGCSIYQLLPGVVATTFAFVEPTPTASSDVIPMLSYEDGAAAMDWLAAAFGFEESVRWINGAGVLEHGEMLTGNGRIMLATPIPTYENPKNHRKTCASARAWSETPWVIDGALVYVDDVAAHFARAKAAGARILTELEDGFPGRRYRAEDCEGHRWMFMQRPTVTD
jgi:uncharacterized glyoxalase superfamily protein PhnB